VTWFSAKMKLKPKSSLARSLYFFERSANFEAMFYQTGSIQRKDGEFGKRSPKSERCKIIIAIRRVRVGVVVFLKGKHPSKCIINTKDTKASGKMVVIIISQLQLKSCPR
jgi:hypothetical protein